MALPITPVLTNFEGIKDMARNITGRNDSDASNPITDAVVGQFVNMRQRQVAMKFPRIRDLHADDAGSVLTLATDDFTYDLAIHTSEINHVLEIWRVNSSTNERNRLRYLPINEFDKRFHPTTSSVSGLPTSYTRRANIIEVAPAPSSDYNGHGLRIVSTIWPKLMDDTTNTTADIKGIENALVSGAVADIYRVIGNEPEKVGFWEVDFSNLAFLAVRNQQMTPDWMSPQMSSEVFA
jgi:hypothetical protein